MSAAAAALVMFGFIQGRDSLAEALPQLTVSLPLAALAWFGTNILLVLASTRLLGLGLRAGYYRVRSRIGWQVWATERVLDLARDLLFPVYASLFTPVWLRLLGARIGRNVEASTVLLIPKMTTVGEGAFLADDTLIASYELGGGWMRIAPAKVGKTLLPRQLRDDGRGTERPQELPRGRALRDPCQGEVRHLLAGQPAGAAATDRHRLRRHAHLQPPRRLKLARALWELCRFVPVVLTVAVAAGVLVAWTGWRAPSLRGGGAPGRCGGPARRRRRRRKRRRRQWLLVGRIRPGEHPLWSSFIWRNEVVDTFIEMVSAHGSRGPRPAPLRWCGGCAPSAPRSGPERGAKATGSPRRTLSPGPQRHGQPRLRGPDPSVPRRVMSIDTVTLEDGATMGPHGVILPRARIGNGGTVGPASLVMRGETVPAATYWMGNPVSPWGGPDVPAPKPK